MGHLLRLIFVVLATYCSGLQAIGPQDIRFQTSPASQELTQQTIHTIFQDSQGYIWILTGEGVNRYDGYSVTKFYASKSTKGSLSHQLAMGIAEDDAGFLWFATGGGGLNKFHPGNQTFTSIRESTSISSKAPLSDSIYSIFRASDGTFWLGYENGGGFSNFNPKTEEFTHFPPRSGSGPTKFTSFTESSGQIIWAAVERPRNCTNRC